MSEGPGLRSRQAVKGLCAAGLPWRTELGAPLDIGGPLYRTAVVDNSSGDVIVLVKVFFDRRQGFE